ncbi:MAG: hypothetical protein ACW9W3_07595 [Candidatus Nitrosopumilus sp. bin_68KS]
MTSKTIKTILFASLIAAMVLPFSGMNFADAKQADDNSLIKEKIKDKMTKLVDKDKKEKETNTKHTSEDYGIPYNLIFEDNGKLVVGIDAKKAKEFNKKYSVDEVKSDLDTNTDLEVRYFEFGRESSLRAGDALTYGIDAATITVVKNDKIVTTGHAFSLNNVVNAGLVGGTSCQEVKITKDNNYSGAYADAAYGIDTYNQNCDHDYINDSLRFNGNTYSVTYGTASDITYNKFIRIAGIQTTSSGYILDTDVTTRDPDGILNDQVIGSYSSTGGDSGAPIFSITGSSTVKLLGQHVGRACEVDLNSGTNFGYWCDQYGNGGLKYFSPWDQVASHLGI